MSHLQEIDLKLLGFSYIEIWWNFDIDKHLKADYVLPYKYTH